ncbi:NAD(P)/FAD-dependent oxidoreductase [Paucibacter sp. R3-3]|uniref:NAD(P)/FAD-dependent oxidoreductase n=1 Tax=Roseateles agri TaxID=3098619 RepID=A0ABU5DMP3_9BURK|nr:NAD(P)/FAD-dependent oxidoreductase [Paucibacter sp. R3-3]MDY0747553.1 NAD(P)/FAD-dependent oxidoreductase [Paucibacter sp. R3-3]
MQKSTIHDFPYRPEVRAEVPFDCVVIGAGPAGLTAAIYLQRFHRRTLLVDAGRSRALKISRSRNCPGYPEGISGSGLLERLREQLGNFGGRLLNDEVTALRAVDDDTFEIILRGQRDCLRTHTVLLCTGVEDRLPRLPGTQQVCEADLLRHCPICDGYEHAGQSVGILGSSDHAVREADFLRGLGALVTVVPLEHGGGAPVAQALALGRSGIEVAMSDREVARFDVLYTALGVAPRSALAETLGVRLDEQRNIRVDAHCKTSVDGVYAAGDVVVGLDQLAVAFGHGAIAATAIHNALRARGLSAHSPGAAPRELQLPLSRSER